ncbi:hypothetical protein CHL78_000840 [Romboutsia weinsteinii]|uniref:Uncharacterized protein n=1 Tax=Romboutsia weinsteinii TaxID=2020949 RepID=A0A371JAR3_9FIRM|nr:hypothetical protein [Romboutsia weinsteinii]RDY29748.1 hypothetical protein CHL78_000840 [Romboutsia weinsteinii]
MTYIKAKLKRFNREFNKEEKQVIILGSLVTILATVMGLGILLMIAKKIFDLYIDLTAPHFIKAMNNIIGFFFEGWTL